jgi:hypothetical protein
LEIIALNVQLKLGYLAMHTILRFLESIQDTSGILSTETLH